MAYVPSFEQDIFISYAQVDDNVPLDKKVQDGWVSHLKQQLQARVDQKLGRTGATKIWMDLDDLAGNEPVTPAIEKALSETAIMLILLSDGYINSVWCQKEVREFVEKTNASGRLFVVHLADITKEDRPEAIQDLVGFNFFDKKLSVELDPSTEEYAQEFLKMRDKLSKKLIEMRAGEEQKLENETHEDFESKSPTVFLSEVTPDLDDSRDAIESYVQKLGYQVLPASYYQRGSKVFTGMLDRDLGQSNLFIQLLGQYATRYTEDFPSGYEGLQLDRALVADVPRIRAYERDSVNFGAIKNKSHEDFLRASDVMALDLEEFKLAIKEKLEQLALIESKPVESADESHVLIHALGQDLEAAKKIRNHLAAKDLPFEIVHEDERLEDLAQIRHYSGLVLVYGEKSPGKWIKERLRTLMNLRLSRRPKEPACALFFDPPEMEDSLLVNVPRFFRRIDSSNAELELSKFIKDLSFHGVP